MKLRFATLKPIMAISILALVSLSGSAEDGRKQVGVILQAQAFKPMIIRSSTLDLFALGYPDDELPHVYARDLNGDGVPDFLITAHTVLCGTGGCPYLLIDGKSRKTIGEFFGSIALINQKINGHPVIQTYSKSYVATVTLSTYVFDGKSYRLISDVLLEDIGFAAWQESLALRGRPQ